MTTASPAQCLACTRLHRTTDPETGVRTVARCDAYPETIPAEIGMGCADHRTPRGDEVGGLVFERASGSVADDAWYWWQRRSTMA